MALLPAAVFDFGQTLVHGDPMYDLALHLRGRGLFDLARWPELEEGMRGYREHLVPYGEAVARIMHAIAAGLRGLPLADFEAACREFYGGSYRDALYPYARPLVAEFRARGMRTVGVTGICETMARVIAEDLELDHVIATPFGVDAQGRLDGTSRYPEDDDWKGRALRRLAAAAGLDLARSVAFGDSEADAPLFLACGRAVCLNARRELLALARERGWTVVPPGADLLPHVRRLLEADDGGAGNAGCGILLA